jgi:hypothetical protein
LAAEAKPKKPARSENLATGSLKLNLPRFPEIRRQTAHIKPPPAHPFHIHTNRVKEHATRQFAPESFKLRIGELAGGGRHRRSAATGTISNFEPPVDQALFFGFPSASLSQAPTEASGEDPRRLTRLVATLIRGGPSRRRRLPPWPFLAGEQPR